MESDRAQRSERADRRSAAADLEGVRSATVGVGGRPSCGEEGGRQVRVVRVALHRPVERHSSRDRAWATKSRWGRWEVGRDSFRAFKSGFARSATLGLPRKAYPAGKGATGAAKFTPRGTTYVFVNVVVAPRYVARLRLGSGGLLDILTIWPPSFDALEGPVRIRSVRPTRTGKGARTRHCPATFFARHRSPPFHTHSERGDIWWWSVRCSFILVSMLLCYANRQ